MLRPFLLVATRGACAEREFFVDHLLVRIHFIIVMIRWTGLAPWEFEFPFSGSLASTFLVAAGCVFRSRGQGGCTHDTASVGGLTPRGLREHFGLSRVYVVSTRTPSWWLHAPRNAEQSQPHLAGIPGKRYSNSHGARPVY